jgi:hypothetical protein
MVHRSEEEFYPDGLNRPNTLDTMKRGSIKLYEKLRQSAKHKASLNTSQLSRKIDSAEGSQTPKNLETKITDILGKYLITSPPQGRSDMEELKMISNKLDNFQSQLTTLVHT